MDQRLMQQLINVTTKIAQILTNDATHDGRFCDYCGMPPREEGHAKDCRVRDLEEALIALQRLALEELLQSQMTPPPAPPPTVILREGDISRQSRKD